MQIKERQRDIIEAAGAILNRSGTGGLTIKNLAAEMDFSESALYRHFSSKEEIIIAMLDYLASDMDKRLLQVNENTKDPEAKFKNIFENQFSFFKNNPHFVAAVFSDCLMEESSRINESILRLMETKRKHLLPVIKEAQKEKIFTYEIPAESILHICLGSFRLMMYKWRTSNFNFNIESKGNEIIKSILLLIKK